MSIEIYAEVGSDPGAIAEGFKKHGIVVLRDVIPDPEHLRSRLDAAFHARKRLALADKPDGYEQAYLLPGDILSYPELEESQFIFLRPAVLEVVRAILKAPLVYFGDSSFQVGSGQRGFHKDCVDRSVGTGPEWRDEAALIRIGYYCQNHGRYSGGLKIRRFSHRAPGHLHGRIYDLSIGPRDFVLWDTRLTHSGNYRKLKFTSIPLHPRLEAGLPKFVFRPEERTRYSCFCVLGRRSAVLDDYVANLQRRKAEYTYTLNKSLPEEQARATLLQSQVEFVNPYPEVYGSEFHLTQVGGS